LVCLEAEIEMHSRYDYFLEFDFFATQELTGTQAGRIKNDEKFSKNKNKNNLAKSSRRKRSFLLSEVCVMAFKVDRLYTAGNEVIAPLTSY
jgi:hypothetical protein